ncbi:helix-turn-helix transcriptional regulator [Xanthobacteraceae bacterium A53D]
MLIDVERLRLAADGLTDAALGVRPWSSVLDDLSVALGVGGINFMPLAGRAPSVPHTDSLSRGLETYFRDGWAARDYRLKCLPLFKTQTVIVDSDFMTEDEYEAEYFRFMTSVGYKFSALIGFSVEQDAMCLAMHRSPERGPITKEEGRHLEFLSSRLSVATALARTMADAGTDGALKAFETMSLGAMAFDRHGKVVRINKAAQAYVGVDLKLSEGLLRAPTLAQTLDLQQKIHAANMGLGLTVKSDAVIRREGKRPLLFRIQSLTGASRDFFGRATVLAVVEDLDQRPMPDERRIQLAFGLTPAEAAVALLLMSGEGAREIAEIRSITYETARTQVKSVLHKLDVRRQSEAAAVLARLKSRGSCRSAARATSEAAAVLARLK